MTKKYKKSLYNLFILIYIVIVLEILLQIQNFFSMQNMPFQQKPYWKSKYKFRPFAWIVTA